MHLRVYVLSLTMIERVTDNSFNCLYVFTINNLFSVATLANFTYKVTTGHSINC